MFAAQTQTEGGREVLLWEIIIGHGQICFSFSGAEERLVRAKILFISTRLKALFLGPSSLNVSVVKWLKENQKEEELKSKGL